MSEHRLPPPFHWLGPLAAALDAPLRQARVESVLSGRDWISLRLDGAFLWAVARPSLRAVWLDEDGLPRAWSEALGRHRRSPFEASLKERPVKGVELLLDAKEEPAGLRLDLDGPVLDLALWPRPGGFLLREAEGGIVTVSPPDLDPAAAPLRPRPAPDRPLDLAAHATRCRDALREHLRREVGRRLRDHLRALHRRARRRREALEEEAAAAAADAELRGRADLLAARLHALRPGLAEVELEDFEGGTVRLRLDPALSPAENLQELYRRAGRAERKIRGVQERLGPARREDEATAAALEALEEDAPLERLLERAAEAGVELRPPAPGEHRGLRRPRRERLPYRVWILAGGREVWVGRSAADNDELTHRRAAPRDLWLHAGGVEGSHVILRHGGRDPSEPEVEAAARLAALFSRARGSSTVPVWVTERRYVRKPRRSPPGTAAPERVRTLFVSPGEPPGAHPESGGD